MSEDFLPITKERISFWQTIFAILILYLISHFMMLYMHSDNLLTPLSIIRFIHILIILNILIFIFWKKRQWKVKYVMPIFLSIFLPAYPFCWLYIADFVHSGEIFAPYNIFRIHFFMLVLIVPGSYLINFFMIFGFAAEALILWKYYDFSNLSNAAIIGEPAGLLITLGVSLALLRSRYRDELMIRMLVTHEARSEIIANVARTFLSIRDRSNTPLQTLGLAIDILKKECKEHPVLIETMQRSLIRLKETSKIFSALEHRITWEEEDLMTEEEILNWLGELREKEAS